MQTYVYEINMHKLRKDDIKMAKENNEKRQALEMAMGQIEKQFGKGSVMKLGEFKAMEVEIGRAHV